jgi:hypothetical protein
MTAVVGTPIMEPSLAAVINDSFESQASDSLTPIMSGLVKKKQVEKSGRRQSSLMPKSTWKERNLVLEKDILRWKDDRWIDLDTIESIEETDENSRAFKVVTQKEVLVIQAPSHREKDEWTAAISRQIHTRSEEYLYVLRRSRAPNIDDELRAYKRLVKTNTIMQRMTTHNIG